MKNKMLNQYNIVLKKELKDAFRDKKSILATFVLPLILFPLFFLIIGISGDSLTEKAVNPRLTIVQGDAIASLSTDSEEYQYFNDNIFSLNSSLQVSYVEVEDFKQSLIDGDIYLAIIVTNTFLNDIQDTTKSVDIQVIYDDRSTSGSTAAGVIVDLINTYSEKLLADRVNEIDPDLSMEPITGNSLSLSQAYDDINRYGTDSAILHLIIPMLLTMLISIGGASIATDLVAGEKERNTFEPLLSTGASRFSILSAKYTVIIIFSFLSAIAEVLSIVLSMLLTKDVFTTSAFSSIYLPVDGVILVVFNLLMLAALFSGLLLILTSTSSTLKEAQSKSTIVMFLPMIIAFATMYVDVADVSMWTMCLPIYNVIISIKLLLAGVMNYAYLWGALAINIVYAVLSVFVTMKTFSKESLITK